MGGSSVPSSAAPKSSDRSASWSGGDTSLRPSSLLPLRMRERFGDWIIEGEDGESKRTFELWDDELAVLLLPLAGSIMDLDRSRVCLDWRNFGNLDGFAGVEADVEWRALEDMMKREREVVRRRRGSCGRWRVAEADCTVGVGGKAWQSWSPIPLSPSNWYQSHKTTPSSAFFFPSQ